MTDEPNSKQTLDDKMDGSADTGEELQNLANVISQIQTKYGTGENVSAEYYQNLLSQLNTLMRKDTVETSYSNNLLRVIYDIWLRVTRKDATKLMEKSRDEVKQLIGGIHKTINEIRRDYLGERRTFNQYLDQMATLSKKREGYDRALNTLDSQMKDIDTIVARKRQGLSMEGISLEVLSPETINENYSELSDRRFRMEDQKTLVEMEQSTTYLDMKMLDSNLEASKNNQVMYRNDMDSLVGSLYKISEKVIPGIDLVGLIKGRMRLANAGKLMEQGVGKHHRVYEDVQTFLGENQGIFKSYEPSFPDSDNHDHADLGGMIAKQGDSSRAAVNELKNEAKQIENKWLYTAN